MLAPVVDILVTGSWRILRILELKVNHQPKLTTQDRTAWSTWAKTIQTLRKPLWNPGLGPWAWKFAPLYKITAKITVVPRTIGIPWHAISTSVTVESGKNNQFQPCLCRWAFLVPYSCLWMATMRRHPFPALCFFICQISSLNANDLFRRTRKWVMIFPTF